MARAASPAASRACSCPAAGPVLQAATGRRCRPRSAVAGRDRGRLPGGRAPVRPPGAAGRPRPDRLAHRAARPAQPRRADQHDRHVGGVDGEPRPRAWTCTPRWRISARYFARLKLPEGIKGGSGRLEGQLSWSGPPSALDLATLNGSITLEAKNGQFVQDRTRDRQADRCAQPAGAPAPRHASTSATSSARASVRRDPRQRRRSSAGWRTPTTSA